MRFSKLSHSARVRAEALLTQWLATPKHANVKPNQRTFYHLVGAAARMAIHGPPPNRQQRLAYRMHKKRRAKLLAVATYGDPTRPD